FGLQAPGKSLPVKNLPEIKQVISLTTKGVLELFTSKPIQAVGCCYRQDKRRRLIGLLNPIRYDEALPFKNTCLEISNSEIKISRCLKFWNIYLPFLNQIYICFTFYYRVIFI